MTAVGISSLERRLLKTVSEVLEAEPVQEWSQQDLQLCLVLLRQLRDNVATRQPLLEQVLANGVEARSFTCDYGPLLPVTEEQIVSARKLLERLTPAGESAVQKMVPELRSLLKATEAFRDLLAQALSKVLEAPRPIDWGRVRASEEAHALGTTKPFSRQ